MLDKLRADRRALHKIPELQFDLPQTQAYLLNELHKTKAKLEPLSPSGILAWFDAGKTDTVAFRSDMDALPITELKSCEYASTHPGRMHACGHDGHMAMLLAFARWADEHLPELNVNLLLIFQPAEEGGGGGRVIAESGALERYHVRHIYGHHVAPELPVGTVASRPGAFFARTSEVFVTIHGKASHAANADEGIDALQAGGDFIARAAKMEADLPENILRLLKFCHFEAGSAPNIIAQTAKIWGTIRSFDDKVFSDMQTALTEIQTSVEKKWGVRIEISYTPSYPPLLNDPELFQKAKKTLSGMDFLELPKPTMLGEDFSFYLQRVPGVFFKVGLGTGIPLHAAEFDFDERALSYGVEAFIRLALAET